VHSHGKPGPVIRPGLLYSDVQVHASRFDSILFDFDGVLADSEGVHFACWTEILKPLGIPLSWEIYCEQCIGITDRDMIEVLCRQKDPPHDFNDLYSQYPRKKAIFRAKAIAEPPIPQSTRDFLRTLSPLKLAVVTSSGRAEVEPVLGSAGIREYFEVLVTGDDVSHRKPHPEPYLLAASLLGASRPLVVEDSEPGVRSGRAAGFDVLHLRDPHALAENVRSRLMGSDSTGKV
jgi:beta-phosphoglucomutase